MPKIEKDLLKVKGSDGQWHYIPAVGGGDTPTWDAVKNKPFESLGDGLSVENGVLSAKGGTGGSANAVQYVAQSLTDAQKAQARKNIEAPARALYAPVASDKGKYFFNSTVGYNELREAYNEGAAVYLAVGIPWTYIVPLLSVSNNTMIFAYFDTVQFYAIKYTVSSNSSISVTFDRVAGDNVVSQYQGTGNAGKILGVGEDGNVIPQDKPTYTLPQATADALGGIKADAATAEDTQDVRMGADGKLRTKPSGGSTVTVDSELSSTSVNPVQNKIITAALAEKITAPTTAAVGQIIKIKSVDDAGKPTEWEAADIPSGSGETWTLIKDITLEEDVASIHEQNLNLKKLYLTMAIVGTSQNTASVNGELRINNETYFYSNVICVAEGIKRWLTSYVELIGDVKRHISAANNNNTYQSTITNIGYFGDGTVINDLKIIPFAGGGKYIGAGTRVKIYGISA